MGGVSHLTVGPGGRLVPPAHTGPYGPTRRVTSAAGARFAVAKVPLLSQRVPTRRVRGRGGTEGPRSATRKPLPERSAHRLVFHSVLTVPRDQEVLARALKL